MWHVDVLADRVAGFIRSMGVYVFVGIMIKVIVKTNYFIKKYLPS